MTFLKYESSDDKSTFRYVASENDYIQILETCRPFYYPAQSDGHLNLNLSPRLEDALRTSPQSPPAIKIQIARVITPEPTEQNMI
mmetsp:Transcript_20771/g.34344  ORF Transcript_20771/g.34344 Transcript_20771/m.34344 type:complete len:85 (+) Transcript_20771:135-389(+)|eukprot:CAMPEP_0119021126 /NCGR_PEP_ID=MMETSP1176-20130426/25366_1 /TAXON_ID=265551 /ORGANISM="Synedropsis recta cf, Strain CCMP1620" /LENGTH=84 /DNA_ID=CAMNT_0006975669 /DNA_START=79 /DNA_END=333 /DNA_ORIENTATION=-